MGYLALHDVISIPDPLQECAKFPVYRNRKRIGVLLIQLKKKYTILSDNRHMPDLACLSVLIHLVSVFFALNLLIEWHVLCTLLCVPHLAHTPHVIHEWIISTKARSSEQCGQK